MLLRMKPFDFYRTSGSQSSSKARTLPIGAFCLRSALPGKVFSDGRGATSSFRQYMALKNLLCSRAQIPEWFDAQLTAEDWNVLLTLSAPRSFAEGAIIVKQDQEEPVAFLTHSGVVAVERIVRSEEERIVHLRELKEPGFLLAEASIFQSTFKSSFQIIAKTPVTLMQLNVPFLLQIFPLLPRLAFRFLSTVAHRLCAHAKVNSINSSLFDLRFISTHTVTGTVQRSLLPRSLFDAFPSLAASVILFGTFDQ